MMVVDTSALITILEREADATQFVTVIANTRDVVTSAMQAHEAGVVLSRRHGAAAAERMWAFLAEHRIRVMPFGVDDARAATAAYQRYGKGTGHPAQLNFADCAAYALATRFGAPQLFKGDDFTQTDVTCATAGV